MLTRLFCEKPGPKNKSFLTAESAEKAQFLPLIYADSHESEQPEISDNPR
jgi:hypothetical protein